LRGSSKDREVSFVHNISLLCLFGSLVLRSSGVFLFSGSTRLSGLLVFLFSVVIANFVAVLVNNELDEGVTSLNSEKLRVIGVATN
jgi:hypothetical protein